MLKESIGIMMIALGVSTADSETLIVPIALMALGMWLARGAVKC